MGKVPSPPVGLIAAGNISDSWLMRWRGLRRWLGPVVALDPRVNARVVSTLRAGSPAVELTGVKLLLIAVPDARLDEALILLGRQPIDWSGVNAVLCDSPREAREALDGLAGRGAAVASIGEFHPADPDRLLAEGDAAALACLRRCLEGVRLRLVEVEAGTKPLYLAALGLLELTYPTLATAIELMRRAGLSPDHGVALAERTLQRMARSARAGRKGLSGVLASGRRTDVEHLLSALSRAEPGLREFYEESMILGLDLLRANPELSQELRQARASAEKAFATLSVSA